MSLPGGPAAAGGERGPSTAATVRRAVLAAAILPVWAGVVLADRVGVAGALAGPAANHLLFAGVACTAIAAALPKFVAVWSDTPLLWGRAAGAAAPLVALGSVGVAAGLLGDATWATVAGGVALAVGVWALAAATGRTLAPVRPWDATERLLLAGVGFLAAGSLLGLAVGAARAGRPAALVGLNPVAAATAHATLMALGGVLSVGYGGVFQLSSMLTGAPDAPRVDRVARAVSVLHPTGVALLAGGRLLGDPTGVGVGGGIALAGALALVGGGVAVAVCAVAAGGVVAHRLRTGGESSATTRRYWGVALALPAWGVAAGVRWIGDPLSRAGALGGATAEPLLWAAVVFLVVGSLYHIGPFLVWLDRYADRLGLEPVPDVAELYDARVERVDGVALAVAVLALVSAGAGLPGPLGVIGGVAGGVAAVGVAYNLVWVVREHAPWPVLARGGRAGAGDDGAGDDGAAGG
ncbi:hypothetical protein Hbl1158_14990 (plasmid) [Halobaculum sp. CBA1158]|uniref:hypothetical protein n=1 Tax=Halobaculum sp. CBA1158 TaxID=2904243 RepID=UPI001F41766B|nr:hypothetical protein [Halobaculum sp. CBA1158]UIP01443.1 hypothetical protein Hbl1158_14990 [Halobaculum sp. CBA1158]